LVNVNVENLLNNNNVDIAVPIQVAAQICGLGIGLLSNRLQQGDVTCALGANQATVSRLTQ